MIDLGTILVTSYRVWIEVQQRTIRYGDPDVEPPQEMRVTVSAETQCEARLGDCPTEEVCRLLAAPGAKRLALWLGPNSLLQPVPITGVFELSADDHGVLLRGALLNDVSTDTIPEAAAEVTRK